MKFQTSLPLNRRFPFAVKAHILIDGGRRVRPFFANEPNYRAEIAYARTRKTRAYFGALISLISVFIFQKLSVTKEGKKLA